MPVDVHPEDGIHWIVINRPERRNALNGKIFSGIAAAIRDFDHDRSSRVAVLTGADPAFCAGIDLHEPQTARLDADSLDRPDVAMRNCTKPIVGAINGATVTGGLELALGCDFLLASDRAVFADTHGRVGLFPGGGMTVLLREAIGARWAAQLSLTGEFIDATTALRIGLVNEVVPHNDLLKRTRDVCAAIAGQDTEHVQRIRAAHRRAGNMFTEDALAAERRESAMQIIPESQMRGLLPGKHAIADQGQPPVKSSGVVDEE